MSATAATGSLTIHVNDALRTLSAPTTVAALLRELGLADRQGIAVAINDAVATRAQWITRELMEGDRVLIIRATQGG
jgi:sulfur carrier protein